MSFGDFGAGDEALKFAEMREQLGALESQLAGAMELGTCDGMEGSCVGGVVSRDVNEVIDRFD